MGKPKAALVPTAWRGGTLHQVMKGTDKKAPPGADQCRDEADAAAHCQQAQGAWQFTLWPGWLPRSICSAM
jgi:hypothetical protein